GQAGGHRLEHHLRTTLRMLAQRKQAGGAGKPVLAQLRWRRRSMEADPVRHDDTGILPGADEVQFALLTLKMRLAPLEQRAQFSAAESADAEPYRGCFEPRRRPLHLVPGHVDTKRDADDLRDIAE